ncbi:MAG: hypothetical protein ACRD2W_12915 [Acidimicrobiales bacterium]
MRRRPSYVAGVGAAVLFASLWTPWFTRRVSDLVAPGIADRSLSGWSVLDELGLVLVATALVAAVWAVRRLPAVVLVVGGALALLVEVAVTTQQLDTAGQNVTTTSPAAGLLLAYGGATAIVLVGLAALLGDVRRRAAAARAP